MNETIAMVLTIFFCNGDAFVKDTNGNNTSQCLDGQPRQERDIKVLSSNGDLVQIKSNEGVMFRLRFDGSTFTGMGFQADPEAIRFWQALGKQLPNVCTALPAIIIQDK